MGKRENVLHYRNSFLPILDVISNTIKSGSSLIFWHSRLMKSSRRRKRDYIQCPLSLLFKSTMSHTEYENHVTMCGADEVRALDCWNNRSVSLKKKREIFRYFLRYIPIVSTVLASGPSPL